MYIQLFIYGTLVAHWQFEDDAQALADQGSTEKREKLWEDRKASCWEDVAAVRPSWVGHAEMAIQVRSRVQPKDISDKEYAQFTQEVVNRQVGKVVGSNHPKMISDKLT